MKNLIGKMKNEEKLAAGLLRTRFLRALFKNSGQGHKEQQDYHQKTSYVKQKKTNISLIKVHMFLTTKIDTNQQIILTPIPNITTGAVGLSSEGTKTGITVEPKNKVPMLLKISANLSSWKSPNKGFDNRILSIIAEIYKDFNGQTCPEVSLLYFGVDDPIERLLARMLYVHASQERVYGAGPITFLPRARGFPQYYVSKYGASSLALTRGEVTGQVSRFLITR